jgi:hypothetical protein
VPRLLRRLEALRAVDGLSIWRQTNEQLAPGQLVLE